MHFTLSRAVVLALLATGAARGEPTTTQDPQPLAPARPKTIQLNDLKGKKVGTVVLVDTPHGLLVRGTLTRFPPGRHAIHFHETGRCEPPFKSAGGHFNPTLKAHGMMDPGGLHAGDLPNLVVPKSGKLAFEVFAEELTLAGGPNTVLDGDGSALIIHAKRDDYHSQPSGDAGDRMACGAITK